MGSYRACHFWCQKARSFQEPPRLNKTYMGLICLDPTSPNFSTQYAIPTCKHIQISCCWKTRTSASAGTNLRHILRSHPVAWHTPTPHYKTHAMINSPQHTDTSLCVHAIFIATQTSLHRNMYVSDKCVHTQTFLHGRFAQTLLHTQVFKHKILMAQTFLHTKLCIHTNLFTQRRVYTWKFFIVFPHKHSDTQTRLHTDTLTHINTRNFTPVVADGKSFRAKGLARAIARSISRQFLPQFLTIAPHFVWQGYRGQLKSAK